MSNRSDVIIVGAGACGLFLAILLAQADISVTVLEAELQDDRSPRVISYMPQLSAEFKKARIWEELVAAAGDMSATDVSFRAVGDEEKSVLFAVPHKPGMPSTLVLPQYEWLRVAKNRLAKLPNARIIYGARVSNTEVIESTSEYTAVIADHKDHEKVTFSAKYVIGADGGRSTVRRLTGITFEGESLPQQLVATDIYYPGFEQAGWSGANFIVDEKYYGMCCPITSDGLWRVSFGVPYSQKQPGSDIKESIPEWFDTILPLRHQENPPEYRVATVGEYRAQQLCATSFRRGRVTLVGDAAHLTNPYMGMGLATGFYDCSSLATLLEAILHSDVSEDLLDQWSTARKAVYHKIVDPLSRAAFSAVQSTNAEELKKKHPMIVKMAQVKAGLAKPGPIPLDTDVTQFDGYKKS